MLAIEADQLCKTYRVYQKREGVWASIGGLFKRGAKAKIGEMAENFGESPVDLDSLRDLMGDAGIAELSNIEADPLGWFQKRLNASRGKAFEYPLAIVKRHGIAGLKERPKIIPGTIHSVKGGEADSVFLFPDLSPQGGQEFNFKPAGIHRMFYVGMTRAIERLFLCKTSGQMAIRW